MYILLTIYMSINTILMIVCIYVYMYIYTYSMFTIWWSSNDEVVMVYIVYTVCK